MKHTFYRYSITLSLLFSILVLSVCSGSSAKKSINGPEKADADLTGTWIVKQEFITNGDHNTEYKTVIVVIKQSGNSLDVDYPDENAHIAGTISGKTVTWKATLSEDGGTISINLTGTVDASGIRISGTAPWTWSDGKYTATGTTNFTGTKAVSGPIDVTGVWDGSWLSSEYSEMGGTFTVNVLQQASKISGIINVPEASLANATLSGTVAENMVTFGDIEGKITFTGYLLADSSLAGVYDYHWQGDEGGWGATKNEHGAIPVVVWNKSDIGFTFTGQDKIIIGDGRNDGTQNIYMGDGMLGNDGTITEFSYSGSQWNHVSFGGTDYELSHITALAIGDVHNDNINRIIAFSSDGYVFTYQSTTWTGEKFPGNIQWTRGTEIGDARNDGINRVYISQSDKILEYTYSNGNWTSLDMSTGGQSVSSLIIIDGRNDGVQRLYASTDWGDHVYEYSWDGSAWQVDDCGASNAVGHEDMVAGDGRNDGINRFYISANGGTYELSYTGQDWEYNILAPVSYASAISLGKGRNTDTNHIYIVEDQGALCEYSYSGQWMKTSVLDGTHNFESIAIGMARHDNVNRVYATCSDKHVYEFSVGD